MRDGDEHLNAEPGKKCAVYFFIYEPPNDADVDDAAAFAIWLHGPNLCSVQSGQQWSRRSC